MKTRVSRLFAFAGLLWTSGLAAPSPEPAGWASNIHLSATATANWVENASQTSHEPSRKDAALYELSLSLSQPRQLAPAWLLQTGFDASYAVEPEFQRNDHFRAGPRVNLQYKHGIGPFAPVLQGETAFVYQDARFSGNSGWTASASLRLAQRLTPAVRVAAFTDWREHYARSAVFDLQQRSYGVEASWDINDRWRLSGSASRLTGEIVVNAAPAIWAQAISGGLGATVFDYYTSVPWSVTELYGTDWVSYNVFAHLDLWSVSLGYQLAENTGLEFSLHSAYVVNRIEVRYPSKIWGLNLSHRF